MKLGILGASSVAFNRFLPALSKCKEFSYAGVASRTVEKAKRFQQTFGGKIYKSYEALLDDDTIDAVYVPLPPALHYIWGKKTLEAGKHLLMEKPFTTSVQDTNELIDMAEKRGLSVYENYMFLYHPQLEKIRQIIQNGDIGVPRLYRMCFGFPKRSMDDFRYRKELGGGALLDCGGYPARLATALLGDSTYVAHAMLNYSDEFEVDISGNAIIENKHGDVAQIGFGMDNEYRCELDIWGSKGSLCAPRIFTAGADVAPTITIRCGGQETTLIVPCFDQFQQSILQFYRGVMQPEHRKEVYQSILHQAELVAVIHKKGDRL